MILNHYDSGYFLKVPSSTNSNSPSIYNSNHMNSTVLYYCITSMIMPAKQDQEIDEIRAAIDKILKMVDEQSKNLQLTSYRLEQVEKKVDEHTKLLMGDVENPGLLVHLARLEQNQKNNSRLLQLLLTMLGGLYVLLLATLLHIIF